MPDLPTRFAVSLVLVMGVSGCGKTTIGKQLAAAPGEDWQFLDADDFHPPANIAKMSAGIPLDDADRAPWLAALRARIDAICGDGGRVVLACSALKARYRAVLIGGRPDAALVWLTGSRALLRERLAARRNHFMKAAMLDNQLATLEAPQASEAAMLITADVTPPPESVADTIRAQLRLV